MSNAQFYHDRAAEARSQADLAELDNVRDRCLRSAGVWQSLADRATRLDAERAVRDAATEERRRLSANDDVAQEL